MKYLVFGAGGYIGVPLCAKLLALGHEVWQADRWFFTKRPLNGLKVDIRSPIEHSIFEGMDAVVDLAGLSNDASAEIDPSLTLEINDGGGKRIASMAKESGVRRYIYSSSASVYGHGEKTYLREDDKLNPLTAYARSKVAVEEHLNAIAGDGFEPVILRNATVFGVAPRMRFDLAVNVMTMRAWKDKRLLIMGGGNQVRPFIHVRDVVDVFCKMLELPADKVAGKTFNVGSDVLNYSISQIGGIVKQNFRDAEMIMVPDDTDKRSYHLSFKKLRDLGIEPSTSIDYGVKEVRAALDKGDISADDPTTVTLSWYKELLAWEKRLNDIRLDDRLL